MKRVTGTKRMLAVALTIAMLLQNSAGVLATDGVSPVSEATQGQSTELQNTDATPKQTDAENSQQETKTPETPGPEKPAQTEAPQTDAPKTEITETDAPKTEATETDAPQPDAPQTSAPETQETPGLTLPDGETNNETSNSGNGNSNGDASGSGSTAETGMTGTESETEPAQTSAPEQSATEKETNDSAETNVYTAKVENSSVQVKVRGESVLPEDSAMTAEAVATSDVDDEVQMIAVRLHEEGQSLLGVEAFDITLSDENGVELHQLSGNVTVELEGLTVPEDAEQIYVYHVSEEGEPEQVKSLAREELTDGILRFETDHFSVYAVAYVKSEDSDAGIMTVAGDDVTLTFETIIMKTPDKGGERGGGTLTEESATVPMGFQVTKTTHTESGNKDIVLSKATAQSGYYFIDWAWEKKDGSYTHISDDKDLDYSAAIKTQPEYTELPHNFSEDATIVARFGKYNNIKLGVSSEDDKRGNKSDHLKVGSDKLQSTEIVVDKRWKNEEGGMQFSTVICTAETGENDNYFVGWRLKNEKDCFSENPVLTYEALCKGIRSDKLAGLSGETYDKELARSHRYIVGDYNVLAVFEPIRGHIGFNLVNECDHFSKDVMSKNELETGDKSTKYIYSPTTYALYDKFDVPSNYVPECNNNQHIFIGWYDKEHKVDKKNDYKNTTGADYVHTSRILQPGTR